MKITDVCIKKPVFAWMLMAATILFGLVAAHAHRHQPVPRRRLPHHHRRGELGGRGARGRRERRRRDPRGGAGPGRGGQEHHLDLAPGQRQHHPRARHLARRRPGAAGRADQDRPGAARLPRDIDPPVVVEDNPEDQPIMWVGLSGPYSRQVLADYARYRVQERLQTVPGVGEITLGGCLERNVRIWLDAARLDEKGLTVGDVIAALQPRARRAAGRAARDRGPRGQRARAGRGARPRDAALDRRPRGRRQPDLPRGRRAGRGRLRGRAPHRPRQRRAGAGDGHPQAARRRTPWPSPRR